MNEENWKAYRPIDELEDNYYIREMLDRHEGVELLFFGENKHKGIKIIFENSYDGYRCVEEGARYRTLCNLIDRYGEVFIHSNCLFTVENSRFVQWLVDESCEVLEKKDLIHFAFLSIDYYVDIVAPYHPKIIHVDIPHR